MSVYRVSVCRTGYGFCEIEVVASSPEEAEEKALEEAGEYDYSEKASEYTTDTARLVNAKWTLEEGVVISKERQGVRVSFENMGEGAHDEWVSGRDLEAPLLRFGVQEQNGTGWDAVEDASYCTQLLATTPMEIITEAIDLILNETVPPIIHGASVKRICEMFSWLAVVDGRLVNPQEAMEVAKKS
jgi:hypothetical protein